MAYFRIISDVHGHYKKYIDIAKQATYSLQLGDLGFDYTEPNTLDPIFHKRIGGNHDNYERQDDRFIYMESGHWLGDYGIHQVPNIEDIFYVRGGYSINRRYLTFGVTWFHDEELFYESMQDALTLYEKVKPNFVCTHECPASIIDDVFGAKTWDDMLIRPSKTANLLEAMWQIHQPKLWIHGHHHSNKKVEIKGTLFQCRKELEFIDFDDKGNLL